jgi:hypothetical protein
MGSHARTPNSNTLDRCARRAVKYVIVVTHRRLVSSHTHIFSLPAYAYRWRPLLLLISRGCSKQIVILSFLFFLPSSGSSVSLGDVLMFHNNTNRRDSILVIMDQGLGCVDHYQRPSSHLLFAILLVDAHCSSHHNTARGVELIVMSLSAELLVICNVILSFRRRDELLDTISIPQHLRSTERTAITEIRCPRTASRCQYHRDTTYISQLSRRISRGCTDLRFSGETST